MGRPVQVLSAGNMYRALFCVLVYLSFSLHSVTAADLDIYPEFADEVIISRIQQALLEWRKKQLRIPPPDHQVLPQFTYHFPEGPIQSSQNFFAVPPSDPRYYEPDIKLGDEKRTEDDIYQSLSKSEGDQVVTPITAEEEVLSRTGDITSEATEPQLDGTEDVSYVFKKVLEYDENIILVAIIAGCGAATVLGVVALFIGWYRLHSNTKAAADIEYPAYGVTGPNKEITPTGDRRLAHSAQMYHYQHQKQQIIAMESNRANNERRGSVSEGESEEENEEGDYTVYECPGLAATGELEVKNPLFLDDPTPAAANHTAEALPTPADKK